MPDPEIVDVANNQPQSRYELRLDGELIGVADYVVEGDRVIMPHTEIVPGYRGRGFGERLVQDALDDIRRSKRTVVARCWYVADFVKLHREYADLVA